MIQVLVNSADVTDQIIQGSLAVSQNITSKVDTADFDVRYAGGKTFIPEYGQEVAIYDGTTKIFGGTVMSVNQSPATRAGGVFFEVQCVDYTYNLDKRLASKSYENETVHDIIADLINSYAPSFTYANVASIFVIEKIVFNQVPVSTCIKRLADILNYNWYVDEEKDVHFFQKYTNIAPFDVTDTDGNYIYKTLKRNTDGSQVANRVKVRGGEYNGAPYTDTLTAGGNDTKSFELPYRFANLTVELDTGGGYVSQNVGIDFIDDFTTDDVLYNFQEQMIRFENNLSDGDKIRFSGNPKRPVFSVAEDPISIAQYGIVEKLIRDDSIESNTVARRRANAELYSYAEPVIDASFKTYTSGLRAGMIVRVQSDLQDIDDELIIKTLSFTMRDHESFVYTAQLVSTKRYDFITLLQKILEPDPRASDESEVAEEIYTDTQIVKVREEIEVISAVSDERTVTVDETYAVDPLGDETDAIYVLAPYTPTSQSDPKRPGRLDISFVVY